MPPASEKEHRLRLKDWNSTLIFTMALLFVSAWNYGFSDQSFASTQATSAFTKQFGELNPKTKKFALPTLYLSLLNSLKAGTQLVGVFVGSYISRRYGRRWCVFLMSLYALGSTAVIVSGLTRAQMLVGRSIQYIYLGMQLAVIPTFLAEISPTHLRGGTGVLYWLAIKCGGLLATGIVNATSRDQGNRAWQLPMDLIFIIPGIIIALIWFVPESPRWLLLNDRHDEALAALVRFRQSRAEMREKAPPSESIMTEFNALSEAVSMLHTPVSLPLPSGSILSWCRYKIQSFLAIFSPEHRGRTTIVVFLLVFQQSTGQSFASQYGTLFVQALNTVNPFNVSIGTNAIDIGGILLCMIMADRVGRRPMLIGSAFLQTAALMTMGGLGAAQPAASAAASEAAKGGIVAMLLLFSFGWSLGYAPLAYVVAAELPSPHLREYTLRLGYTAKLIMEFVVSFTYPYLEDADEANLGGRLGFIYGSVALVCLVFSIFCVPETNRVELEDMDNHFGHGLVADSTESDNMGSTERRELNKCDGRP